MEFSKSSIHLRFLSFQTHQKIQIGIIFQIAALLGLPDFHQYANKSITLLGIIQGIPKRVKVLFHIAEATAQWRRRWSTDSSSLLHKQHVSTMMICLFLRLSTVRILPRAADHAKKAALEGAWVCHTLPMEESTFRASQGAEEGLDLEQISLGRDPPEPICTISTHHGWVQHLKEGSKDTRFSIMCLSNKAHVSLSRTTKTFILSAT